MRAIRLDPLGRRWAQDVTRLIADPGVLRFTRIPEPPPDGFVDEWLRSYEEGRRSGERDGFAALGSDESFLGVGLAPRISRPDGEIELGYIVAADARGRGVGTEILRQLTDWAFEVVEAQRAYLIIDLENHASARVAERCGYEREGVMRSIHLKAGRRVDAGLWSRLPSDPDPS